MSAINNRAEALRLLRIANRVDGGSEVKDGEVFLTDSDALAAAQVHATLYLAEQQRIANLIAMLPRLDDTATFDRFDNDRPLPTERGETIASIREGLGL